MWMPMHKRQLTKQHKKPNASTSYEIQLLVRELSWEISRNRRIRNSFWSFCQRPIPALLLPVQDSFDLPWGSSRWNWSTSAATDFLYCLRICLSERRRCTDGGVSSPRPHSKKKRKKKILSRGGLNRKINGHLLGGGDNLCPCTQLYVTS